MSQKDKDRDAFEVWYGSPRRDTEGNYTALRDQISFEIWQAARDHYTPKSREAETVEKAAQEIWRRSEDSYAEGGWAWFEMASSDAGKKRQEMFRNTAREVLRAAGVQFKEEA